MNGLSGRQKIQKFKGIYANSKIMNQNNKTQALKQHPKTYKNKKKVTKGGSNSNRPMFVTYINRSKEQKQG